MLMVQLKAKLYGSLTCPGFMLMVNFRLWYGNFKYCFVRIDPHITAELTTINRGYTRLFNDTA